MSMLTLFESREGTAIGNVGRTASMSMLTLFESREGTALVMLTKLFP